MPKITALPIATTAGTGDLLVLDQANITKSIDFNVMQSAIGNAATVANLIAASPGVGSKFLAAGVGAVTRTVQSKERDVISLLDFGADPTGAVDSSGAANNFFSALTSAASGSTQDGAIGVMPKGNYLFSAQVIFTVPNFGRCTILCGGAEIKTSGAISGIQITGGATGGAASIHGLQINHRANATATFGFDLVHASNIKLYDCYVRAHGNQAGYAAYHLANSNPADDSTGSLWNSLINCGEGMDSGGDGTNIPFGVLLEGAANANRILGGQYGRNTTECVHAQPHAGQTTVANALVIDGTSFEGFTTAVHFDGQAASLFNGLRVVNSRFESGTTVFSLTGSTTQPATYPFFAGNYITPAGGTYINNPNNLQYISLDQLVFTVNQINSGVQANLILNVAAGQAFVIQNAGVNSIISDGLTLKPAVSGALNIGTQALRWGAGNFSGQLSMGDKIFAGSPPALPQAIVGMYMGTGVPSNSFGNNFDFYLRGDGGLGSTIFVKRLGSWTVA
jgi:hypothetical protein